MSRKIIEYHLSRFGAIQIHFYDVSSRVFDMLESNGFVEKMKANPQLGAIQRAYEGAHHTRWEYVVVQLYLLEELKSHGRFSGLNSPREYYGFNLTSYEIIQIWILVLNAFHLYGTFSNERAFLVYLKSNRDARSAFKKGLPINDNVMKFFEDVLNNDKTYLVHELMAFFMLGRMKRKWKDISLLTLAVLDQYRHPAPKSHVVPIRQFFKKIRQIAFLYLDSQYSTSPITLDINHLLSNKDAFVEIVSENGVMTTAIDYFQRILCKTFYLSRRSLVSLRMQQEKALRELRSVAPRTISELASIIHGKDKALGLHREPADRESIHFFIEEHKSPRCICRVKSIEDEIRFNKKLARSGAFCMLKKDPSQTILAFNIDVSSANTAFKKCVIACSVANILYDLKINNDMPNEMVSEGLQEIVMFMLTMCNGGLKYEFKGVAGVESHWVVESGSVKAAKAVENMIYEFKEQNVSKDKICELEGLKVAIQDVKFKGIHIITSDAVIIKDDKNHRADMDGVCILASPREPYILHVQTKNKPRAVISKSKEQLCGANMALNLCKGFSCDLLNPCFKVKERSVFSKVSCRSIYS